MRRNLHVVPSSRVVAIVGNPKPASRTRLAAELVAAELVARGEGLDGVDVIDLADHGPGLLQWGDPGTAALKAAVLDAAALVIASPTYKAAYTGLLKLFLDQFDAGELGGVPTVAVMTGGSPAHSLVADVHLLPVLLEIGASCPARGLYVWGPEVDDPAPAIERWLATAGAPLARALRP